MGLRQRRARRKNMTIKAIKTTGLSFVLAAAFLVVAGATDIWAAIFPVGDDGDV